MKLLKSILTKIKRKFFPHKICVNCFYWEIECGFNKRSQAAKEKYEKYGELCCGYCHYNPPVLVEYHGDGKGSWEVPETFAFEYCGKWKRGIILEDGEI